MALYTFEELSRRVNRLDGTPARIPNEAQTELLTFNVREGFRRALNSNFPDEQPNGQGSPGLKFEEKMKRYEIAKKIWFSEEQGVELSVEECNELKKCVGKLFFGEALGFLSDVIEKKDTPKDIS